MFTIEEYISFGLIKPHGSVNWLIGKRSDDPLVPREYNFDLTSRYRLASSKMFGGPSIDANNLRIYDPFHNDLNNPDQLFRSFDNQYFYPLIFMPLATKMYSTIANFSDRVLAAGKDMFAKASNIYLIGYRASDDIIKELFTDVKQGTVLHVVGVDDATQIAESVLASDRRFDKGTVLTSGFADFVASY